MRRKQMLYVSMLLIIAAFSATSVSSRTVPALGAGTAQQPGASVPGTAKVEPIADGDKTPASIPDEVALRAIFLTPNVPANSGPDAATRLRAKLSRMQLDASDMDLTLQELGKLQALAGTQLGRIAAAREQGRESPAQVTFANLAALDAQLDTMLADTYRKLLASLSSSGADKLRNHVAYAKTKIKIIPPPNMTTPHH